MQNNWHEFKNFRKILVITITSFILDLLFATLTFICYSLDFAYSKPLTLILLFIDTLLLLGTVIHLRFSQISIKQFEDTFRRDNHASVTDKLSNFHKLLENNLFLYHFQPIVDAKTGEIFAYEALMRTDPNTIDLTPVQILELATKECCLYSIERFTFYNTLRIMNEHKKLFQSKKLFINSISSHQLTDIDFEELYHNYCSLFRNVVLEITETTILSEDGLIQIRKRLQETGCQLSLDDYGTGYSNESNLLNSNPNYIRIDSSILRYIKIDSNKQHIITSLINFAVQNEIKIIAEGIETYEEFEYFLNLGVDYIQGYYTAKPSPELITKISEDIIEKIQELYGSNQQKAYSKKSYEANGDTILSPIALALDMYSDVIIREREITLRGDKDMIANLSLIIPDNHACRIVLDNVSLRGIDKSAIQLGKNCKVTLELIGNNSITYDCIRVPETSELRIIGDGNLVVHAERNNQVSIGGTALQAYGNILLASNGSIKVISNGNMSVGIGGGQNPYNSFIHILSGNIYIETSGYNTVGIGSISGNAKVKINNAKVKITSEGTKAIGIGSIRGFIDISSTGNLIIKCNGKHVIAVGALDDSDGRITIEDGIINIRFNSHCGSGIGALGGRVGIDISKGDIEIFGEGTDIIGIGAHTGFGDIRITNGTISVRLYAANATPIGNIRQNIIIDGGNIRCDFPEEIVPVNTYGTPLVARLIMSSNEFRQTVDNVAYSYEYQASYCERYPYIKVYLPESVSF